MFSSFRARAGLCFLIVLTWNTGIAQETATAIAAGNQVSFA